MINILFIIGLIFSVFGLIMVAVDFFKVVVLGIIPPIKLPPGYISLGGNLIGVEEWKSKELDKETNK